jgi:hypothetical protein
MKRQEQVRRNLALAREHLTDLLEHPEQLANGPDRETIVLIPSDDPELAKANLKLAGHVVAARQSVSLTPTR